MKIIITESQYKRLLTEDDKSFLGGEVNFPNIKNVIDPLIAKVYVTIYNDVGWVDGSYMSDSNPLSNHSFSKAVEEIKAITDFSKSECILLAHNYVNYLNDIKSVSESGDWKSLIGKPLEFYGKFKHPKQIYYYANVTGWGPGEVSGYATNFEDFIENINNSNIELERTGSWGDIDYDCSDVDFDTDWDYTYDTLSDADYDIDNVKIVV